MVHDAQRETDGKAASRRAARPAFELWLNAALARDYADTLAEPLPEEWYRLLAAGSPRDGA